MRICILVAIFDYPHIYADSYRQRVKYGLKYVKAIMYECRINWHEKLRRVSCGNVKQKRFFNIKKMRIIDKKNRLYFFLIYEILILGS